MLHFSHFRIHTNLHLWNNALNFNFYSDWHTHLRLKLSLKLVLNKNENETEPEMSFNCYLLSVRWLNNTGRVQLFVVFEEIIDISFGQQTHSYIHQFIKIVQVKYKVFESSIQSIKSQRQIINTMQYRTNNWSPCNYDRGNNMKRYVAIGCEFSYRIFCIISNNY